ncbi:hypothetical protein QFC19_002753 [Naganishia cerealis]|uniref:Uncharacterized protein n=1 Tax=Naganishia cerealis TaxID=610337 RepID=A0ACC2W9T3_9TREE|nr:hypothetical protein QFC19_002753 [Naganishia cerealis]
MVTPVLQSLTSAEDVNVDRQSEAARRDSLYARQELRNSASMFGESDTLSSSASGDTASGTSTSDPRPTQVNAPSQIGLIMPNPYSNVYTALIASQAGVEYRMGYVDPGPAPRVNGALRLVTPLLTYPNYSTCSNSVQTNAFPEVESLNADPKSHTDEIGWCSLGPEPV